VVVSFCSTGAGALIVVCSEVFGLFVLAIYILPK